MACVDGVVPMILLSKATIRVAVVAILLTAPVLSSGQDSPVPVIPAASQEPAVDHGA